MKPFTVNRKVLFKPYSWHLVSVAVSTLSSVFEDFPGGQGPCDFHSPCGQHDVLTQFNALPLPLLGNLLCAGHRGGQMGPLPCSSPSQVQQQTQGRQLSVTILGWWRGKCCAQLETLCESGGGRG